MVIKDMGVTGAARQAWEAPSPVKKYMTGSWGGSRVLVYCDDSSWLRI